MSNQSRKFVITAPTQEQINKLFKEKQIQDLLKEQNKETNETTEPVVKTITPETVVQQEKIETIKQNSSKWAQIGDRVELFVDDELIQNTRGLVREVHPPVAQEIALTFDKPWEGNVSVYWTIMEDDDRLRMYYRGAEYNPYTKEENGYKTCYAESFDGGLTWNKPELGIFEYEGSKDNNIVWISSKGSENFTPFKDTRPGVPAKEKYKAIGFRMHQYKLYAFCSEDAIHWRFMRSDPLLTYYHGKFDSQNICFWNPDIEHYMMFFRSYLDKENNIGRGIKVAISKDFFHWKNFEWLKFNDQFTLDQMQLYTNCIQRYYRAPHHLIGFPNRFNEKRNGYPGHPIPGIFDAIFMTSRDGYNWTRYHDAIIRPGPQPNKWATRNNITAWGMVETPSRLPGAPNEMSVFVSEGYFLDKCSLRRYAFRQDGFVSFKANLNGGELLTKPFIFSGNRLILNYSTSVLGNIKVEIRDKFGNPIAPYLLQNCQELFGDKVDEAVRWKYVGKNIIPMLQGKPIRLRFVMLDAHLYSFQFKTVARLEASVNNSEV